MRFHEPVSGAAPQSDVDLAPLLEELWCLDPRFDVRWEPRAVMTKRGSYSVEGKVVHPEYRGLWEIILRDKAFSTAEWRGWTRVCFVTQQVEVAPGLKAMVQDGEYAPFDMAVVEFLRQSDKHNQDGARRMQERLDKLNERADAAAAIAGEEGEREALERQYHAGTKAGGGVSEFHPVRIALTK